MGTLALLSWVVFLIRLGGQDLKGELHMFVCLVSLMFALTQDAKPKGLDADLNSTKVREKLNSNKKPSKK